MADISNDADQETFEIFKNSFSYGSRSDLNFKFLKSLTVADAAQFLQDLLYILGDTTNDGEVDRVIDHIYAGQMRAYSGPSHFIYAEGPYTPLRKPLADSRVALLTSSGHFVDGDDPEPFGIKNMTQGEAMERIDDFLKVEPVLSVIPIDTPVEKLRVRHGGYDIRGAQADPNVVFPLERMRELDGDGRIGELAANAYSFVGACAQTLLLKRTAPKWATMLQSQNIDAVVMVPV